MYHLHPSSRGGLDPARPTRGDHRDLSAFEESLARCEAKAYRLAVELVCSDPVAREIVEETFSSAWQKLGSFASSSEIQTWVYQSTVKSALERGPCLEEQSRSSHDHRLVLAMSARKLSMRVKGDEASDPVPCSRRSLRIGRRVQRVVDALPKGLRAVLILCDVEEMAPGELGRLLGVPSEEVKRRLSTARAAVRDAVKGSRTPAVSPTSSRTVSKRAF